MQRSHKLFALLTVFILLLGSTAFAQDDGLKLTGWPYEVDVVTENLGRFTDQSGHDAVFLPFPSNEYHDKMVASFVAGTEFDVAYVRDSYLAEWASAGWILPITGLPNSEELLADLPQGIIEQMSYNGEVYGLPYYSGVQTMAYNAAHLEAAGIDAPPATWDEMLEQGQMIKDAGVVDFPILMQLRSGENYLLREWETLTASRGGRLFDDDLNPLFHLEDSPARQALEWLTAGLEMGVIDPASITDDDGTLLMAAGTTSFMTTTDYTLKAMNDPEQSNVAGDIKNALVPGTDEVRSGTWGYVRLYSITNNAAGHGRRLATVTIPGWQGRHRCLLCAEALGAGIRPGLFAGRHSTKTKTCATPSPAGLIRTCSASKPNTPSPAPIASCLSSPIGKSAVGVRCKRPSSATRTKAMCSTNWPKNGTN